MKLTETKLRQIIREEMQQEFGGEMYHTQFKNYLSSVGSGREYEFEYKGYYFTLDPMDYALNVSMYRDRRSDQPIASARIEDQGVRFKAPAADVSGPNIQDAMYRSPNQVIDKLIKMG